MPANLVGLVLTPAGVSPPESLIEGLTQLVTLHVASTAEEIVDVIQDVDFIIVLGRGELKNVLEGQSDWPRRLRWIAQSGIGVDGLLFPRLIDSDVIVTNMRGVSMYGTAMAEFAFASIMLFAKKMLDIERHRADRQWTRVRHALLHGQTVGIVGFGTIGRELARLAAGFGMDVVATKRHPDGDAPPGVTIYPSNELDSVLSVSDYLAVCAPRTAETAKLIGAREIALMKPGAVIVNVARGGMVDEPALRAALISGHLGGASLDVFETEPLPADDPLWTTPNLFISPHMSAFVDIDPIEIGEAMLDNVRRFVNGEELVRVVDKRLGY
ncbi:MAG: D-2-hydroxyacid dehydrogenase [Thermomicrobiales bacterium]